MIGYPASPKAGRPFGPGGGIRATSSAALALVLALLCAACFSERAELTGTGEGECRLGVGSDAVGAVGTVVAIRDFAFQPAEIRIPRGSRVTWVNCEPEAVESHTTTADGGEWSSPLLSTGEEFSRVFDTPGEFEYHCSPHPFMRATVIVE